MAFKKLDSQRQVFRCSSSISNWREKLKQRTKLKEWTWFYLFKPCIFFGMYHIGDYIRFILHRGKRKVFWCGSDILSMEKSFFRFFLPYFKATHFCENEVEMIYLLTFGIKSKISPMIFDNPEIFSDSYISGNTHVFICAHEERKDEYGILLIEGIASTIPEITFHIYGIQGINHDNIVYHGKVSEHQFNEEIKNYHACLRLNTFDGFGEILAKSVLLGQYPISRIQYPYIDYVKDIPELLAALRSLKNKKKSNLKARDYWINKLNKSLCEVLSL